MEIDTGASLSFIGDQEFTSWQSLSGAPGHQMCSGGHIQGRSVYRGDLSVEHGGLPVIAGKG